MRYNYIHTLYQKNQDTITVTVKKRNVKSKFLLLTVDSTSSTIRRQCLNLKR